MDCRLDRDQCWGDSALRYSHTAVAGCHCSVLARLGRSALAKSLQSLRWNFEVVVT
jgi:hypothetical protein